MKIIKILGIIIFVSALIAIVINIEYYTFGYEAEYVTDNTIRLDNYITDEEIPNTSIYSYKVDTKIRGKEDFVEFLKKYKPNDQYNMYSLEFDLDNFKDSKGNVVWEDVYDSIKVTHKLWKTIYSLEYETHYDECNGNKISISSHGYVLDYRSSGF